MRICSHGGGSKNLDAFITQTKALINERLSWQALGIAVDDAVRICSHIGGSKNLNALIHLIKKSNENNQTLESCFGLTLTKIVQLLSQRGGAKQLYQAISEPLFTFSWENDDIQAIKALLISEQDDEQDFHDVFSSSHEQPLSVTCDISSQNDNINRIIDTDNTPTKCLQLNRGDSGDDEEGNLGLFGDVFDAHEELPPSIKIKALAAIPAKNENSLRSTDLQSIANIGKNDSAGITEALDKRGFFTKPGDHKRKQRNDNTEKQTLKKPK